MIALCGGGTGGHIYPAIAMAQELGAQHCFFIVSEDRVDSEIVSRYGFATFSIPFSKKQKIRGLFGAFIQARKILKAKSPKALIATGGYFTAPIILAAKTLGIPIYLSEQNVLPGRVNRVMAYLATTVYSSFKESRNYFPKFVTVKALGNPVRSAFLNVEPAKEWVGIFSDGDPLLVIIGGSQGAAALNQLVLRHKDEWLNSNYRVLHLMGAGGYKSAFGDSPVTVISNTNGEPRIVHLPYFESMDLIYKNAHVAIARAGATTLAELRHFQVPAVLVPYPFAKDDHQRLNAEIAEIEGGTITVSEADLLKMPLSELFKRIQSISMPKGSEVTASVAKQIASDITSQIA